jgi:alpha-beta hydrolase superfamily lysophospholipase
VLIFTAEGDLLVNNKPVFKAAKRAPNIEHVHLKGAKHELLMETDDIRDKVLKKSMELIDSLCNHPTPPR